MTDGPLLILTPSEAYSIECEIRQSLAMAVSPCLLPHLRQAYQGRLRYLIAKLASARVVQVPNAWAPLQSSVAGFSPPDNQASALPAGTQASSDEISPSPDTKLETVEPIHASNDTLEPSITMDQGEKQAKTVRISRFTIERTGSSDKFYFLENTTASFVASPIKGILKPARILPSYPESYPDPVPRGAFLLAERIKRVNAHQEVDNLSEKPPSLKVFKVQFDLNRNTTHPIYSREEYYRSDGIIACKTRDSTRDVAIEMNRYKAQEMDVHPQSHANTRYLPVSP